MRRSFWWALALVVAFGALVFWPKKKEIQQGVLNTPEPTSEEHVPKHFAPSDDTLGSRRHPRNDGAGVRVPARHNFPRDRVERQPRQPADGVQRSQRDGKYYQWLAPQGIRPVIRMSESPTFPADAAEWLADSVILMTVDSETSESLMKQLASRGAQAVMAIGESRKLWQVSIRPTDSDDFFAIADLLSAAAGVKSIDYDFVFRAGVVSNDTLLPMQYGVGDAQTTGVVLTPDGYSLVNQAAGANVNAITAWDTKRDCSAIRVAVLDSGIDATHPDLAENLDMTLSRNFVSNANLQDDCSQNSFSSPAGGDTSIDSTKIDDENGHGTHVAGTIGAVGNNGVGVAGVCWKAKIVTLRAMNKCGRGTNSAILAAIDYASKNSVRVMNMSLGGNTSAANIAPGGIGYQAIDAFANAGGLAVAAAGNSNSDNAANPVFPASVDHPALISVASHNALNEISNYSNFSNTKVHLAAPGEGVLSTMPQTITSNTPTFFKSNASSLPAVEKFKQAAQNFPDVGYDFKDGTSMAAPHVAGVAAVVWSMDPGRTNTEVKNLIYETSDLVPGFQSKVESGRRVNLGRAIAASEGFALRQGGAANSEANSAVVGGSEPVYVQMNPENVAQLKSAKLFLGATEIGTCSEFDGTCVGRVPGATNGGSSEALSIQSGSGTMTIGFLKTVQLSQANGLFSPNSARFSCRVQNGSKTLASFKVKSTTVCKNLCRMLAPRQSAELSSCLFGDKSESLTLEACDATGK